MIFANGPVQLVIFDCDGVLVDSERIAARVQVAPGVAPPGPATPPDQVAPPPTPPPPPRPAR
ncbi:hypothetical protein ACFV2B_19750, partial [Streptomyces lavendulae]